MNKQTVSLICIFLCKLTLMQGAETNSPQLNKTEFRSAAFFPMGKQFKEIYGNVGLSVQFEQARRLKTHKNLEIWGNLEWILVNGEPVYSCGNTDINMLNISLGLKALGNIYQDWIYLYAGIGPNLGIIFIENQINCCVNCDDSSQNKHSCDVGIGGIAKSGCQMFLTTHFFLDFFVDYLYLPIHFNNTRDVGGFKIGGGLSAKY